MARIKKIIKISKYKIGKVDLFLNSLRFPRVKRVPGIKYGTQGEDLTLDIYYPRKRKKITPVIVNIHGGFYIYNEKERRAGYCGYLASQGFIVLNVEYGQSPKFVFPDQIRNICLALKWVEENHEKYGFDINRVALSGDGTGAYLACQVAVANTSDKVRSEIDVTCPNFTIKAVLLFRGYYDLNLLIDSSTISRSTEQKLFKTILGKDISEANELKYKNYLSPVNYVNTLFPDTYFAYDKEESDRAEQARRLKNMLVRNGVPNWEFRNIRNRYVRSPETEDSPKYKIMECIKTAVDFLELTFFDKIMVDEYHEI